MMPRIPYKPHDNAGPEEVVAPIRARRGGRLLNIDRMLLHSLPYAAGWGTFLRAVRTELALPYKLRELAMVSVASLTGTRYEMHHHTPEFLKAGGTQAQLDLLLRDVTQAAGDAAMFDASERAVLRLALQMTRNVQVSDETFAATRAALPDERQMVELVGVIAAYNMVARFIVALDIQPE